MAFLYTKFHGGESHGLNDRVHGISVFQFCKDFCGKLLHIVEKHLDEWLPGILRWYVHFIA